MSYIKLFRKWLIFSHLSIAANIGYCNVLNCFIMASPLDISYRERQKKTDVIRGRKTDKDVKKDNDMKKR